MEILYFFLGDISTNSLNFQGINKVNNNLMSADRILHDQLLLNYSSSYMMYFAIWVI